MVGGYFAIWVFFKMPRSILKKGGRSGKGKEMSRRIWGSAETWPRRPSGSGSVRFSEDSDGTDLCRLIGNMMLDKCRRGDTLRIAARTPRRDLIKHLQTQVAIDRRVALLEQYHKKLVDSFDGELGTFRGEVDLRGRRFRVLRFTEGDECQIVECLVRTIDDDVVYENLVPAFRREGDEHMPIRAPVDFHDKVLYCV